MRSYANAALAASTRNAQQATSENVVGRATFRGLLRLIHAFPPVQRMMFYRTTPTD